MFVWTISFEPQNILSPNLVCLCSISQNVMQKHWFTLFNVRVTVRAYGVVPKGLLTFLGSLYKEGTKTTSGTLVYRFGRQTTRKNISSFQKHCVINLECRILSQEHDTIGKQTQNKKNPWRHWLSRKQLQTFLLWLREFNELRKSFPRSKLRIA